MRIRELLTDNMAAPSGQFHKMTTDVKTSDLQSSCEEIDQSLRLIEQQSREITSQLKILDGYRSLSFSGHHDDLDDDWCYHKFVVKQREFLTVICLMCRYEVRIVENCPETCECYKLGDLRDEVMKMLGHEDHIYTLSRPRNFSASASTPSYLARDGGVSSTPSRSVNAVKKRVKRGGRIQTGR